jgi:hypothetical protein
MEALAEYTTFKSKWTSRLDGLLQEYLPVHVDRTKTSESEITPRSFSLLNVEDDVTETPWMTSAQLEAQKSRKLYDEDEFSDDEDDDQDTTPIDSEAEKDRQTSDTFQEVLAQNGAGSNKPENVIRLLNDESTLPKTEPDEAKEAGIKSEPATIKSEEPEDAIEESSIGGIGDNVAFGDLW